MSFNSTDSMDDDGMSEDDLMSVSSRPNTFKPESSQRGQTSDIKSRDNNYDTLGGEHSYLGVSPVKVDPANHDSLL